MQVDPYILAFSAITVAITIWMGFRSARTSKTASDFFVAGRNVSVGWNASAISGEYLSAASFMGVAGMVMSVGYDALWYPVCYACGYLFLLLFIAGPLRRFGAYTIPDFAEGRFDSPVFRKIAVVFVLFIGFFYTMPQMKGAGTTLAYIFPGLPYWAGVVLVGAVITLNVALGGMKGITLVQAFQYWAKMFAISVPVFVLMAVYGNYNEQIRLNRTDDRAAPIMAATQDQVSEAVRVFYSVHSKPANQPSFWKQIQSRVMPFRGGEIFVGTNCNIVRVVDAYARYRVGGHGSEWSIHIARPLVSPERGMEGRDSTLKTIPVPTNFSGSSYGKYLRELLATNGIAIAHVGSSGVKAFPVNQAGYYLKSPIPRESGALALDFSAAERKPMPERAPADATWLNPFGPLTTKAAKAAAAALANQPSATVIPLRSDLVPEQRVSLGLSSPTVSQALAVYSELTGRQLLPRTNTVPERINELFNGKLSQWKLVPPTPAPDSGLRFHNDGAFTVGEVKAEIEAQLRANGVRLVPEGAKEFRALPAGDASLPADASDKVWLAKHERPLALVYTYSLIIALVCGTAGLPHILVRFYTNPDGVAAKRTTMWVMILIGVFYVFPPVFGVMGRNLLPELYSGIGAKGTDKIVLELPRILNERIGVLGSILSGITCAGAFAAFMSTFSGLLVSMTGAMAHDVYGRMLNPKATANQRLRAFKIAAIGIGGVSIALGMQVEPLEINFMVGQAFAIAAASYFPLLFMAVWWRKLTMKGAATGMLAGGLSALLGISLTSFSTLAVAPGKTGDLFALFRPLNGFWAAHPLLRILCEQPAIWAMPLAIVLMVIVSKVTSREVPQDIRMKMLVLHAPETLGLKQEYIQEHQHGH